mmetsp:Transcript_26753/g.44391  ORF Transcript_26753/g.44391 Transcript_26753/m.44391 type:complete len:86 (+) Transcript_26753:138-395(+)
MIVCRDPSLSHTTCMVSTQVQGTEPHAPLESRFMHERILWLRATVGNRVSRKLHKKLLLGLRLMPRRRLKLLLMPRGESAPHGMA